MRGEASFWSRRYVIWSSLNWLLFLAAVAFLTWGADRLALPTFAIVAIALLAAISVAIQFFAAYRLVAVQDEFVRALNFKRGMAAAGLTITFAVGWGLAQQFLPVPRAPLWIVYPLFWGAYGLVTPFIRSSHA